MSAINTSQDLVKGIDFTITNPQTASQHNQLVELSTPLEITSSVGVGFVLTTTDTALNTPDVPSPVASAEYNKWKRYVWHRRPYAGAADKTSKFYSWNDDVTTSDATYLKWQVVDVASQTTISEAFRQVSDGVINGTTTFTSATAVFTTADEGKYIVAAGIPAGTTILTRNSATNVTMSAAATTSATGVLTSIQNELETPLQCALDFLIIQSSNAEATANAANATVTALQTACIGSEDPTSITTPLLDQIEANATAIATDGTELDAIRTWASGNPANLTDNNGINGQIAALQDTVAEMGATAVPVTRLTPGAISGSMLRTNAGASAAEWYDPVGVGNLIMGDGAGTNASSATVAQASGIALDAGTYLLTAYAAGWVHKVTTSAALKLQLVVSGGGTYSGRSTLHGGGDDAPCSINMIAKVVVTAATTAVLSIVATSADYTSGGYQFSFQKLSAKNV